MKYINEERFIVTSNNKDALRKYADNYDRVFGDDVIAKSLEPNASPVVSEHTVRDPDTGSEVDVTMHEDGSVTVVAERIVNPCGVCGATDHERIEAFGGTVQGCPQVPPGTAVCVPNSDAIECRLGSYANYIVSGPAMSFPAEEGCCPHCGRKLDEYGLCPDL